jgi:hypothetical protein
MIAIIQNQSFVNLTYDELSNFYQLYSGNLDSKKIDSIFARYGLSINLNTNELKHVKDFRNKLAHGEISFEECGRQISLPYLDNIIRKTFASLETLLTEITDYLDAEKYQAAP